MYLCRIAWPFAIFTYQLEIPTLQVHQQGEDDDGEEMQAVAMDDGHGNVQEFMQKRIRFGHIAYAASCSSQLLCSRTA